MGKKNELFTDMAEFKAKYAFKADEIKYIEKCDKSGLFNNETISVVKSQVLEQSVIELKALLEKHKL